MGDNFFAEDKLHEECGVFGIYSKKDDVALNTYWGLFALQHRGQESAGIAVTDGRHMHIKKGMGLVNDVFKDGLKGLDGYIAAGHVRYSTTGASMPYNVQPLKVFYDGGNLAMSHNGNLTNAAELRKELAADGVVFQTTIDSEVVLSLIARSRKKTLPERVAEAADTIKGAFAILIMNDSQLIAFRDPYGFRPLCLGRLDHGWVVASENTACAKLMWRIPRCTQIMRRIISGGWKIMRMRPAYSAWSAVQTEKRCSPCAILRTANRNSPLPCRSLRFCLTAMPRSSAAPERRLPSPARIVCVRLRCRDTVRFCSSCKIEKQPKRISFPLPYTITNC